MTLLKNSETITSKTASIVNVAKFQAIGSVISSIIYEELMKDLALVDEHTLEKLKQMGHPYGVGEYSDLATGNTMRSGKLSKSPLPHVDPAIHRQSGNLADSVEKVVNISRTKAVFGAVVNEGKAPYIKFLVHGTTKMVPRPVFVYCWNRIRDNVLKRLEEELRNALRVRK
jgi:hypothetical protein